MPYQVDISKPPTQLVRELFNYENGTSFQDGDITVYSGPHASNKVGYNSCLVLEVAPHLTAADVAKVTIHYNRIDLATLFSEVPCHLKRSVDLVTGQPSLNKVVAELSTRYGFNVNDTYHISSSQGNETLTVTDSQAMHGSVSYTYHQPFKNRWTFNGDVQDTVGGKHFINYGALSTLVGGRQCYRVGGNRYLELENFTLGGSAWSFSLLYYPTDFTGYTHLFSAYPTQGLFAFKLSRAGGGVPYFHTQSVGSHFGSQGLVLNRWNHVVYTYNGAGRLRIYIDGTMTLNKTGVVTSTATSVVRVGQAHGEEHGEGYISRLHHYDYELTPQDVTFLTNNL